MNRPGGRAGDRTLCFGPRLIQVASPRNSERVTAWHIPAVGSASPTQLCGAARCAPLGNWRGAGSVSREQGKRPRTPNSCPGSCLLAARRAEQRQAGSSICRLPARIATGLAKGQGKREEQERRGRRREEGEAREPPTGGGFLAHAILVSSSIHKQVSGGLNAHGNSGRTAYIGRETIWKILGLVLVLPVRERGRSVRQRGHAKHSLWIW